MALVSAVDTITEVLDAKKHAIAIFLDFRKAFDTVDPAILLSRLWHYGVRGVAHHWFSSYLSLRTQRVKLDNIFIDNINIFIIFVNCEWSLGPKHGFMNTLGG